MSDEQKNNKLNFLLGAVIIVAISIGVYGYFEYDKRYPSTDDAYVTSNLVNVSSKVSGYLQKLNIKNNQLVHKGDVLFALNPIDYQLSYNQAQQNYASQVAMLATTNEQLSVQKNQNLADKVQYNFLFQRANRYNELYKAKTISQEMYQSAMTDFNRMKAQLKVDEKKYQQIVQLKQYSEAKRYLAKSQLDSAKTNLIYTQYIAPVDGYISNMSTLTTGELVSAGQQLFGIVDSKSWWVDANFKETQLSRIKIGQPATVKLDMYDNKFAGVVDSISYASGNTFSLLPAQNATGNWVKVTQRFSVRVRIKNDLQYPLRVGASAKVKINTN